MESTVAIISLGGKQHLVSQGTTVVVNKIAPKEGEVLNLPDMLSNRAVQVKVLSHQLGKKVNGLKFKAKTRYFKRYGHRQSESTVEIISIGGEAQKTKPETVKSATMKTSPKSKVAKTKKVTNGKA